MKADLLAIGKITKHHGIRGGLRMMPFFDLKDLLAHLRELWLVKAEQVESFSVEWVRRGGRFLILKLQGVNDPAAAQRLRGWQVAVSRDSLPSLPRGQYYTFQIVGLRVFTEGGELWGEIREVWPMPAHDVYRVVGERGEVLIPAVKEIVIQIDLERGQMVIRPLEGLIE